MCLLFGITIIQWRIQINCSVNVLSSVLCAEMDISLDNPSFLMDVSDQVDVHQADVPFNASGSSSLGETARRSCSRCHSRMSSLSLNRHLFCIKHRGAECDHDSRCDECLKWTKEEIDSYIKLRKSLKSKNRSLKSTSRSSSSPPWSTAPDSDLGTRFVTQLDNVNRSIDKKIDDVALMIRFASMFEQFRSELTQTSVPGDPAVPGPSVRHTEPPSLPHPVSTKSREGLRFRGGGEDPVPHGSDLAHQLSDSTSHALGAEAADSRDPPPEGGESSQAPGVSPAPGLVMGGRLRLT